MPDMASIVTLPPDAIAWMLLGMAEVVMIAAASMRYGPDISRRVFALTPQEKDVLQPLTAEWLKAQIPKITPGEMLAIAIAVSLSMKVITAEHLLDVRQPPRPQPPPPPPRAGSADAAPPPAAVV
jgi:hypothetical protein